MHPLNVVAAMRVSMESFRLQCVCVTAVCMYCGCVLYAETKSSMYLRLGYIRKQLEKTYHHTKIKEIDWLPSLI